jgi:hypothetical protein
VFETDHIRFELPWQSTAEELSALLGSSFAYRGVDDAAWSVEVELGEDPEALASLLRQVEAWVAERRLWAIRYELDGRWYVMEAGEMPSVIAAVEAA